jgi:hypothetical protein
MSKFKPLVILKTLEALLHELDGEPGYEEVYVLVEQAVEACKEAMDPQANGLDVEGVHLDFAPNKATTIPYDKGAPETYPEADDD